MKNKISYFKIFLLNFFRRIKKNIKLYLIFFFNKNLIYLYICEHLLDSSFSGYPRIFFKDDKKISLLEFFKLILLNLFFFEIFQFIFINEFIKSTKIQIYLFFFIIFSIINRYLELEMIKSFLIKTNFFLIFNYFLIFFFGILKYFDLAFKNISSLDLFLSNNLFFLFSNILVNLIFLISKKNNLFGNNKKNFLNFLIITFFNWTECFPHLLEEFFYISLEDNILSTTYFFARSIQIRILETYKDFQSDSYLIKKEFKFFQFFSIFSFPIFLLIGIFENKFNIFLYIYLYSVLIFKMKIFKEILLKKNLNKYLNKIILIFFIFLILFCFSKSISLIYFLIIIWIKNFIRFLIFSNQKIIEKNLKKFF